MVDRRPLIDLTEPTGYTGPLTVAAQFGTLGRPDDTGSHTVILLGVALDCATGERVRARMEMTPEEADDLALALKQMSKSARMKR